MAVRQPTLPGLPGKSALGSYVYALKFSTGIVKVGLTSSPSRRISNYLTYLVPFGISIADQWVSEPHGRAEDNEIALLRFCRARASEVTSREYFVGVDFGDLTTFAGTLPFVALAVDGSAHSSPSPFTSGSQSAAAVSDRPKWRPPVIELDPNAEIDHDELVTPYRQLAAVLKARIARGDWAPGRRMASENDLVQQYGLARTTVRRAIAVLVEDGAVTVVPQRGTFVTEKPPAS